MVLTYRAVEISLLSAGLLMAFLYFALRATLVDTFLWIVVMPLIVALYMLVAARRYAGWRLNALDRVVIAYAAYGLGAAALGILIFDVSRSVEVKILVHFYAPSVFYFLARRYTLGSPINAGRIFKLIWVLAILLAVDFVIEYYLVLVRGSGALVPWVGLYLSTLSPDDTVQWKSYSSEQILTFLTGVKKPGMVGVMLVAIILPLAFLKPERIMGIYLYRPSAIKRIIYLTVAGILAFISIQTANDTAAITIPLIIIIAIAAVRSTKGAMIAGMFIAGGVLLFADDAEGIIRAQFIHQNSEGVTAFAYTVNPQGILDTYQDPDLSTLGLGAHLTGYGNGYTASGPTGQSGSTEVRSANFPIYFGIGWALIFLIGMVVAWRYAWRLFSVVELKWFGVAFLGVMAVVAVDLHYPSAIEHGPFEILLVLAGTLSSLHEFSLRPRIVSVANEPGSLVMADHRSA